MAHYVVGDIHGCYRAWMRLKNRIEKMDKDAKFILVGDIVDRGPEVITMIRWAMENVTPDGRYQMVIGNHETEKISWLNVFFNTALEYSDTSNALYYMWDDNYDFRYNLFKEKIDMSEIVRIKQFFDSLPYVKELDITYAKKKKHYIIVHGGIPESCFNVNETFKKSSLKHEAKEFAYGRYLIRDMKEAVVWQRTEGGYPRLKSTIVINGHTPTISTMELNNGAVPGRIHYCPSNINIDCGMTYYFENHNEFPMAVYANLAAIRLEDFEEFYAYKRKVDRRTKRYKDNELFRQQMKGELIDE